VNLLDVYDSEGQWEPAARLVKEERERVLVSVMVSPSQRQPATEARSRGVLSRGDASPLEGLDYVFSPCNFIHARGDDSQFLPEAIRQRVGLIAMKRLASGSIVQLDPRVKMQTAPEFPHVELWQQSNKPGLRSGAFIEPAAWYDPAVRHGERPSRRLIWNGLRLARNVPETPCRLCLARQAGGPRTWRPAPRCQQTERALGHHLPKSLGFLRPAPLASLPSSPNARHSCVPVRPMNRTHQVRLGIRATTAIP